MPPGGPWQEQVQEKQGVVPGTGSVWVTVVVLMKLLLVPLLVGGTKEV